MPEVADDPLKVAFIRAPVIVEMGPGVRVLAEHDGHPVVVRQERILAASCHPEIRGDARLHGYFVNCVVRGHERLRSQDGLRGTLNAL